MTVRLPGRFLCVTLPGMIAVILAFAFRLARFGSVHPIVNVHLLAEVPKYASTGTAIASRVALGLNVGTTDAVGRAASVPQAMPSRT